MWQEGPSRMRLLFVHERFGSLASAGANLLATATELNRRGHAVGVVHAPSTGGAFCAESFLQQFPLNGDGNASRMLAALEQFQPDAVCVHAMRDVEALEALVASAVPVVR